MFPPAFSPHQPTRREAFTITEVLISITLVALLAVLLVVSTQQLRATSKQVKCVSNLRQVASALLAYAGENRHKITSPTAGNDIQTPHIWSHRLFAQGYLNEKEALRCPAGEADIVLERSGWAWQTYGLCMFGTAGSTETHVVAPRWRYSIDLQKVASPSTYPLVADSAVASGERYNQTFRIIASVTSGVHLRHRGGANVLFADGHVAALNESELRQLPVPSAIPLYKD